MVTKKTEPRLSKISPSEKAKPKPLDDDLRWTLSLVKDDLELILKEVTLALKTSKPKKTR
jgi:hypothetical protein